MSASGKSSNRHREYSRARSTGSGHGIYAAEGIRDYQRAQERREPTPTRANKRATRKSQPSTPVPLSLIGLGVLGIYAVAGVLTVARKLRGGI